MPVGAGYRVTSCDLGVFVQQAAEPVSPDDLDIGIEGWVVLAGVYRSNIRLGVVTYGFAAEL
jgi:hypothetical protein